MIDENLTAVLNFESSINENGELDLPADKLAELHTKGFEKVNVVIFGSSVNAVNAKGMDVELFKKIKKLQTLPDTVVLDFLSCKGGLTNSDIKSRIEK